MILAYLAAQQLRETLRIFHEPGENLPREIFRTEIQLELGPLREPASVHRCARSRGGVRGRAAAVNQGAYTGRGLPGCS